MLVRLLNSQVVKSFLQTCPGSPSIACRASLFRRIKLLSGGTGQSLFGGIGQVSCVREYHELVVKSLPLIATEESVRHHFSQFGMVLSVNIRRNAKTMESEGHGRVAFADKEALQKSLDCQPHLIDNQAVIIRPRQEIRFLVTELSPSSTEQSLESYFSRFGKVLRCNIKRNLTKGKNCGFLYFSDQYEINECLTSNVHVIDGTRVGVRCLFPKELTLFVGNLSPTTTDQSLRAYYSHFGSLLKAEVKRDRLTGESRCFAYVCFSSQQGLDNAARSLPHVIDGNEVRMDYNTREFTLFVARLPPNITEDYLRNYFERYGPVYRCDIARDKRTNQLRDFGWLIFSSKEALDKALAFCPHVIDGKGIDAVIPKDDKVAPTLYIGGLSPRTTDGMLYNVFSKFGSIVRLEVKLDPMTGQSRRFGYVRYSSLNEVSKVLLSGPHIVDGSVLRVEPEHQSKTPRNVASSNYGVKNSY